MKGAYGLAIFTIIMMLNLILFLGILNKLVGGVSDLSEYYGIEQINEELPGQINTTSESIFSQFEDSREKINYALDRLAENGYNLREIPIIRLISP